MLRPFLKWAGGKRQLLTQLRRFYPGQFGRYIEPFTGSGAVFFDLHNRGLLSGHDSVLIDNNWDLIGCYEAVRDDVEKVIRHLARLAAARSAGPHAHYYRIRDRRFNVLRRRLIDRGSRVYTPSLAAMLIYLNRTGFNGLFRQNASGAFNVPIGRYTNPQICDAENLRRVAAALAGSRTRILHGDFELAVNEARQGDFLYFDPPYAPLTSTAFFTSYTAHGFGDEEQVRLQQMVIALARRGCHILLSNSTAPLIERLYDDSVEARSAGLSVRRIPARRAINSNAALRGDVMEYLVTNVPERPESAVQPG